MQTRLGVAASPGIAIARAVVLDSEDFPIPQRRIDPNLTADEVIRVVRAFDSAIWELTELEEQQEDLGRVDISDLFCVHRHFLQDKSLQNKIIHLVDSQALTAECAIDQVLEDLHQHFYRTEDRYISERAADIADMKRRLLKHIIDVRHTALENLDYEAVVVAKDLRPTQAALFDPRFIKGIACDSGGKTSHASIVARSLGIPAVVALEDLTSVARHGTQVIVDGNTGLVIVDPDEKTLAEFRTAADSITALQEDLANLQQEPAVTRDGETITLRANIEFPEEINHVLRVEAEGVGLFRTEFLYLQSGVEPTEEVHYEAYAKVIKAMDGRSVTIRIMDLGADKFTQSHRFVPETNPFLGLRSIRFSLKHQDMLVAQLRAILRASVLGPVRILIPLITTIKELAAVRVILNNVKADLTATGVEFADCIPVGIMIETPSSALMARKLATQVDFFSIGSNDLTQYVLAVDRGNAQVAHIFSAAEPAVLQLIKATVEGAKDKGIEVSLCGEMAAEPKFTMLLLGLGLRSLSLTPQMIPEVKKIIRSVSLEECEKLAQTALNAESAEEVLDTLVENTRPLLPEYFR